MIKDSYCCSNCFENEFIKDYINENFIDEGDCPYCKKRNVELVNITNGGLLDMFPRENILPLLK